MAKSTTRGSKNKDPRLVCTLFRYLNMLSVVTKDGVTASNINRCPARSEHDNARDYSALGSCSPGFSNSSNRIAGTIQTRIVKPEITVLGKQYISWRESNGYSDH
jgi:hypothetical protein